jgi:hypothetical protein
VVGSADAEDFRAQLEVVQQRHGWAAGDRRHRAAGELSTTVNVLLAGARSGGRLRALAPLVRQVAAAGPGATWVFLRSSRIGQRSLSRVRAGLLRRRDHGVG